ncbi:MAG TPA: dihydroxyacetone kinase subunit L [Eubacteriaceae bacterium]|jgi:dihydroxyacetone kinase-like protein|nr:dihydroxyacetone kinase subunit L [Eubacteriaceae bacterium]
MKSGYLVRLLKEISDIMEENKEYLIDLDSIVGDGDLGLTMSDGFKAAYEAIKDTEEQDAGKLLYIAGKKMASAVPSTMGTLMASGLMSAGKALKGKNNLDLQEIGLLFESYQEGVISRGKANIGEKTFIDGLNPAIQSLKKSINNEESLKEAARKASISSQRGFEETKGMIAVHGRAATRGEASKTLYDPGACVAALMMQAFESSLDRPLKNNSKIDY